MGLVYSFPIWLADRYYIDDLRRSITGLTLWEDAGRPFASWLTSIANFQYPWKATLLDAHVLVDTGPLLQILSIAILAVGATLLGLRIFDQTIHSSMVFVVFPIIGSPFLLENLSYRFDALSMTAALTISIIAALTIKHDKLDISIGALLLFIAYGLYQPSVNVFIGTSALVILAELWNNNIYAWHIAYRNIAKFLIASLIYELAVLTLFPPWSEYGIKHSQMIIPTNADAFLLVIRNIGNVGARITELLSDVPILCSVAVLSVMIFGVKVTSKGTVYQDKIVHFSVFAVSTLALLFSTHGILLFLQNPILSPRTFIGFTIVLVYMLFCVRAAVGSFTRVATICLVFPIYYLYFIAFTYGAAAKSQTEYDYQLGASIMQNLNSLGFQPESVLIFDGTQPRSPVLENSKRSRIIDRLIQLHIDNQWLWGYIFMEHQGFHFTRSRADNIPSEIAVICNREPAVAEQRYEIYKYDNMFVVGFQNGGCFQKSRIK
jgi:Glucosyl transferase GtrII